MKICCLSDSHCHQRKIKVPEADLIIHAGDFTYHGELDEVNKFLDWYGKLQAKHKVVICGNHEVWISKYFQQLQELCVNQGIHLLHNSHITIEGLKIYGSPYSPTFGIGWAYQATPTELKSIYGNIDGDTDIVVTHGPAYGILDKTLRGDLVGSPELTERLNELPNLKLHVTGHIHESRGVHVGKYTTVNAAICGIPYTDVLINPITVEI